MSFFDKFLDAVRLNDDYDEDDDDFFDEDDDNDSDYDDETESKPKKKLFGRKKKKQQTDDYDDYDDDEEPEPRKTSTRSETPKYSSRSSSTASRPAASQKVTPMRRRSPGVSSGGMEVCVIKPTKVEDYREIADTLLSGCTVVLNLEGIDVELAQRIIDFSSGSCYAIGGGLQKVSSYIFILTPSSVEISGDIQDLLGGAIPAMRTSV